MLALNAVCFNPLVSMITQFGDVNKPKLDVRWKLEREKDKLAACCWTFVREFLLPITPGGRQVISELSLPSRTRPRLDILFPDIPSSSFDGPDHFLGYDWPELELNNPREPYGAALARYKAGVQEMFASREPLPTGRADVGAAAEGISQNADETAKPEKHAEECNTAESVAEQLPPHGSEHQDEEGSKHEPSKAKKNKKKKKKGRKADAGADGNDTCTAEAQATAVEVDAAQPSLELSASSDEKGQQAVCSHSAPAQRRQLPPVVPALPTGSFSRSIS